MAEAILSSNIPISESLLRELSRDLSGVLPNFQEREPALGVKELRALIEPILNTADLADLTASHRAATYNILCAIIERCQASKAQYARDAVLDDSIWNRLFDVYLLRSDNAKGKTVRQVLLVLTGALLNNQSPRSLDLQQTAATTFIDIICRRQDRLKVKPALQGLAHFIQKKVISIAQLRDVYSKLGNPCPDPTPETDTTRNLFSAFLGWIVHHDTSLSAGHLIKNFLTQLRRLPQCADPERDSIVSSIWIRPVIETLHLWPDRIQEFKTHVFPYCFLPDVDEYLQFLSYLRFDHHVDFSGHLPSQLKSQASHGSILDGSEEFKILLAAIETGKEFGIVVDTDYRIYQSVEFEHKILSIPSRIFGSWLSHPAPEARLAGLYLSIYSTAATKPITGGIFDYLRRSMTQLHADTDTNFRRELLGYIQKLFDRIRGSTSTLIRTSDKSGNTTQNRLALPNDTLKVARRYLPPTMQNPLVEALSFATWYIRFFKWELRIDAPYQRRITALRALIVVLKSGIDPRIPHHLLSKGAQGQLRWAHGLHIPDRHLVRSLLDLTLDPFDDVRDASVSALQLCLEAFPEAEKITALGKLPHFIQRAEVAMLQTGRADQADGVARAYALYFASTPQMLESEALAQSQSMSRFAILTGLVDQLRDTLDIANRNLSEAVNGRPVHGTFAAIRYIIDQEQFYPELRSTSENDLLQWEQMHDTILASIEKMWLCVIDTLCADAPEGHVPEDLEEMAILDTKEILSYSWRGLKEASILLRTIISRAPISAQDNGLLTPEAFAKLGRLCFTQLVELRHRGAFSTVAQTFAAFCRRCISADDRTIRELPEMWYAETLATIQAKADTITRRSGGIPALMTAIIAAEPQPGGKLFPRAMRDLIAEASSDAQSSNIEESRLPHVHALNCIKEIFMTSKLSVASEAYLADGLELAAKTLNSKMYVLSKCPPAVSLTPDRWPIRNCSLMLFKALIERLLGSDEAQDWKERDRGQTSRFSYDNFPALINILKNLLDPEGPLKQSLDTPDSNSPMDLHGAEGVFPALQVLRQAAPPEEHRATVVNSIGKLFASPHWHLRDMAARTVTSLQYSGQVSTLLKSPSMLSGPTNENHGTWLYKRYMLSKFLQQSTYLEPKALISFMQDLLSCAPCEYVESTCPFTKTAFLDLVGLCGMAVVRMPIQETTIDAWARLTESICIGPKCALGITSTVDNALFRRSLAQVFFIDRSIIPPHSLDVMGSDEYQSIGDALILLSDEDPDTCIAALEGLRDILKLEDSPGSLKSSTLILQQVYHLTQAARDPEVLESAQAVLAAGLSRHNHAPGILNHLQPDDLLTTLKKLEIQCLEGAPSNLRSALHLLGFFLDVTYEKHLSLRQELEQRIARYVRLLRMTIIDTNPFDDRFAAVQSISALKHIWTLSPTSKKTSPLLLGLAFILYDMLYDDDDEIRDAAALATTRLLQAHTSSKTSPPATKPAVPILTSHRLAIFLVTTFPTSPSLHKEALRRLTNTALLFTTPFTTSLALARQEDASLFITEKQNLFKDDTLDAHLWARVLSQIPASRVSAPLREGLTSWVLDALRVLASTARSERDGALGWSSKVEVFTLGMRVVSAAEVVLAWDGGEAEGEVLREGLMAFAEAGREGDVNGLWMEGVEKVLSRSVERVFARVGGRVLRVQGALGA